MQFKPTKDPSFRSQVLVDWWMAAVEETHQIRLKNMIGSQERETKYASGKEMTFAVGGKV